MWKHQSLDNSNSLGRVSTSGRYFLERQVGKWCTIYPGSIPSTQLFFVNLPFLLLKVSIPSSNPTISNMAIHGNPTISSWFSHWFSWSSDAMGTIWHSTRVPMDWWSRASSGILHTKKLSNLSAPGRDMAWLKQTAWRQGVVSSGAEQTC